MDEFRLPDRLRELVAVEKELLEEFHRKETIYQQVRDNMPAGVSPMKTPAFYSLLVAHRRWQFAYEKRTRMEGKKNRASL
jgi:hypothetical protein